MKIIEKVFTITGFFAFVMSIVLPQPNLMIPGLALLAFALVVNRIARVAKKLAH